MTLGGQVETIFGRRVDHHSREEGRALLVSIAQSVSGWFDIRFKSIIPTAGQDAPFA